MSKKVKKVLLVEDDPAIIDIYQMMIKKGGFDVEVLSLGQLVIKKIKDIQAGQQPCPDVMLLDLVLPDMNGMDILKEARNNSATKDMLIFFLTNQTLDIDSLGEIKPDKLITKANITPSDLVALIKKELK